MFPFIMSLEEAVDLLNVCNRLKPARICCVTPLSTVLIRHGQSTSHILNTGMAREYLNEIPNHILNQILVDNSLNDFYKNMEEHLLNDRPHYNYYNEDKFFVNTIKYTKNKIDLPFWKSLRRVRMTDETLYKYGDVFGKRYGF